MGNIRLIIKETLLVLLALTVGIKVWGQENNSIPSKRDFRPLLTGELPKDGSICILASVNTEGGLYALSSEKEGGKINKMKSKKLEKNEAGYVIIPTGDCQWIIERVGDNGIRLRTSDGKRYLTRKGDEKTDLVLVDAPSDMALWYAEVTTDAKFHLYATEKKVRQLALDQNTSGGFSFANYSTSYIGEQAIVIYQKQSTPHGYNQKPQQGKNVCLTSPDLLQSRLNDGSASLTYDALLFDGSMARWDDLAVWSVEFIDDMSFALKGKTGYLSYRLTEDGERMGWAVDNDGWLYTMEENPRYLAFSNTTWRLVSQKSEAEASGRLVVVADEPTRRVSEQSVSALEGGWTASKLASLSFEGVKCLDLTAISLPIHSKDFVASLSSSNVPIFVRQADGEVVPRSWRFVVACGSEENVLSDGCLEIADKQPLFTDRDIKIRVGQVVYHRTGMKEKQWQTFSLPFDADVVSGSLYQLVGEKDDVLNFEKTMQVKADEGYIGMATENGKVSFSSKAGFIRHSSNVSSELIGNVTPLVVAEANGATYMLHPTEQCFKRAAVGSRLAPFRAYLKEVGKVSRKGIRLMK